MQTLWCPVGNKPAPAWHCNTFKHVDFTRYLLKGGLCASLCMNFFDIWIFICRSASVYSVYFTVINQSKWSNESLN